MVHRSRGDAVRGGEVTLLAHRDEPASLREKLLAAVRTEFSGDVIVFDPGTRCSEGLPARSRAACGSGTVKGCATVTISDGGRRVVPRSAPSSATTTRGACVVPSVMRCRSSSARSP